jgi:hypothetical protein
MAWTPVCLRCPISADRETHFGAKDAPFRRIPRLIRRWNPACGLLFQSPMKIWLCLAASLPLVGCYTQLYTRGYAERAAYPYPYAQSERAAGDSAVADSLTDSLAAADSARTPNTVIVNNYYQDRTSYRGYSIDAWDNPYISLGFYSGRYQDYYGPYWWNDPYYHRRGYSRRYEGRPGGGSGPVGPYHSDKRLFAPAPAQPLHKGHRSEPAASSTPSTAPSPAPKAADPAPTQSSGSSSGSSSSGSTSDGGSSSSSSSGSSSGSASGSGNDHPDLHKGRRH